MSVATYSSSNCFSQANQFSPLNSASSNFSGLSQNRNTLFAKNVTQIVSSPLERDFFFPFDSSGTQFSITGLSTGTPTMVWQAWSTALWASPTHRSTLAIVLPQIICKDLQIPWSSWSGQRPFFTGPLLCVDYSLSLRQNISSERRLILTYSSEDSVQIQSIDVVWLISLLVYQETEGPG